MNRPSNATPPSPGDVQNGHVQNGHVQNGHVQNGHVLTDNGQWLPTHAMPGQFRLSTLPKAPPKNQHTIRNVLLIVATLGVIGAGAGTALVVGGPGAASQTIEVDPQTITAVLAGWVAISTATAAAYAGLRELVKRAQRRAVNSRQQPPPPADSFAAIRQGVIELAADTASPTHARFLPCCRGGGRDEQAGQHRPLADGQSQRWPRPRNRF